MIEWEQDDASVEFTIVFHKRCASSLTLETVVTVPAR